MSGFTGSEAKDLLSLKTVSGKVIYDKNKYNGMTNFQPPRGTRDFPPEEMRKRNFIVETIRSVFERFGFEPLETPAFESWGLLSKKGSGGEEIKDEIYYFKDKSERELGLRFDLTVPMARFVASNPQLQKPFKRYQIGRVWRYDRPQAGRFREFLQADVDIIGSEKMDSEAECLAVAVFALKALGFKDFSIRLNNRKILNGLIEFVKIPEAKSQDVFRILDKLEKIGEKGVLEELEKKIGKKAREILKLINVKGKPETVLKKQKSLLKNITIALEGLKELGEIITKTRAYGINKEIVIDLSLVRGLDYYTGPIYEVSAKTGKDIGSLAGGGRYDNLIELYGGRPTPATGFSFGVERIYEVMSREKMFRLPKTQTKVFVVSLNEKTLKTSIKLAQKLRNSGIPTQTDVMGRGLQKQLEYANKIGIPYSIIVGEREVKENKFILKDMGTGKQRKLKIDKIMKELS